MGDLHAPGLTAFRKKSIGGFPKAAGGRRFRNPCKRVKRAPCSIVTIIAIEVSGRRQPVGSEPSTGKNLTLQPDPNIRQFSHLTQQQIKSHRFI